MNNLDRIYEKTGTNGAEFAKEYCRYLSQLLAQLDYSKINAFAKKLLEARNEGRTIFFMGNGGSAATASHFANDLSIGPRDFEKPFKALALTDNVAVMTAIGNDFGYEDLFYLQLKTQLKRGDLVVAISASGNSPNIMKAIKYANEAGAFTIGLTGFDGGRLAKEVHLELRVETAKGEYGPVEDLHMVFDHLLGAYLMRVIQTPQPKTSKDSSLQATVS